MKYILLIILIFGGSGIVQSQDIILSGKMIDQNSKEPIGFVHVSLCSRALGTTSNENGDFRLILPPTAKTDSLCISCIGYVNKKISIARLMSQNTPFIELEANIEELETIQVRSKKLPPAKILVEKAIKRIEKNFPASPHLMEGYYRDFLRDSTGQNFLHLVESAIGIYDPGYEEADESTRIKVYQSRHANGYPLNYSDFYENNLGGRSGNISIMGGNELSILMYNNPVRNYRRISDLKTGYELDESFLNNHRFEIAYISESKGETIYGIDIEANTNNPYLAKFIGTRQPNENYQMKGKIYIRENDLAIMKMEYTIVHQTPTKTEVLNELKLDFKSYKDKMYLHYISFSNFIVIKRDFTQERYRHFRELFIHQILTENLPPPDTFYLFSTIGKLHNQSYLNKPNFWEKYNMVLQYMP